MKPASQKNSKLEKIMKAEIGNTKLVEIKHLEISKNIRVFAKLEHEGKAGTGSIKDRAAHRIIKELLEDNNYVLENKAGYFTRRKLKYNSNLEILDSTSGNYGISLAHFGNLIGLKIELVIPGNIPKGLLEKITSYGVEPILTDPLKGYNGTIDKVKELAKDAKYLYLNQYDNLGNLNAHYDGTGREIWNQISELTDNKLTDFVAGVGTGGTIIGASSYLIKKNQDINVYSVHPQDDLVGIQGLQPFVKGKIRTNIFNAHSGLVNENIFVTTDEVVKQWEDLVNFGFNVGMSSGANIAGIIKMIEKGRINKGIVATVFSDNFDRYNSI